MAANCHITTTKKNDIARSSAWYVVYTRYKCEKQVAQELRKKGLTAYVPLMEKVRKYGSRRRTSLIPLIHCYVFVLMKPKDRLVVLQTTNVQRFLGDGRELIRVPEEEINWLRRIVGEIDEVEVNSTDFEDGMAVEVVSGPLAGVRGKLLNRQGKSRFLVELTSIGYQLQMAIDKGILKRAEPGLKFA